MRKSKSINEAKLQTEMTLRPMTEEDLIRVQEIEARCFETPWSVEAFRNELKNHLAIYHLAILEDWIVGYCGVWIVVDEGHITNLAIDPQAQDHGLGRKMLNLVIDWAKLNNICRLTLEVRVSNEKAIYLYETLGFQSAGLRKGYYEDTGEDASIMWLEL